MLRIRTTILILGDVAIAYLALFAALYIRYGAVFEYEGFGDHIFHFTIIYIIWFFAFFIYDLFSIGRIVKFIDFLKGYIFAIGTAIILAIIYFYIQSAFSIIAPKTFLLIVAGIFFFLSILWHRFLLLGLGRGFTKNVVIIGINEISDTILEEIKRHSGLGYKVVSFVDSDDDVGRKKIDSIDVVSIKDFKKLVFEGLKIDLAVVAVDLARDKNILDDLFSMLSLRKIEFVNAFSFYEKLTGRVFLGPVGKIWFLENIHYSKAYNVVKKVIDIIFGFIAGLLFLAFLPFIALMIKLSSRGPVFYKQERLGLGNEMFTLYKFRTMIKNAENNGPMLAEQNDKRITKVGGMLRKLRLDELPQIINIFKGEMSLIGPRPERLEWIERFEKEIPFHKERSLVKPGLTGWAQANWHYASTIDAMKTRLQYDLYYIKNRSLILDIEVILKTIRMVLRGRGR